MTYLAFSLDGTRIISASSDATIRIWNASSGEEESQFTGHSLSVIALSISPDGSRLVSGSDDTTLRIWRINSSGNRGNRPSSLPHAVDSISFSPDGTKMASISQDRIMSTWGAQSGEIVQQFSARRSGEAYICGPCSLLFSHSGTVIATGFGDGTVRLWNAQNGTEDLCLTLLNDDDDCFQFATFKIQTHVAFSPDDTRLVAAVSQIGVTTGTIMMGLWDAKSGVQLWQLTPPQRRGTLQSVEFSPDGCQIFTGLADGVLVTRDAETGNEVTTTGSPEAHTFEFTSDRFGLYRRGFSGPLCLSDEQRWILGPDEQKLCFLPAECHYITTWCIFGTKIGLGCRSGSVFIIETGTTLRGASWALPYIKENSFDEDSEW